MDIEACVLPSVCPDSESDESANLGPIFLQRMHSGKEFAGFLDNHESQVVGATLHCVENEAPTADDRKNL